ncbi:GntP family permease [Fusobacterium ulcerans]|uniref:Gluconate:H+ symporter (GntP) family transporter n=1 Tax=Fusobacterium ulcerans 12-1B TaxID=457404 RepID=H1PTW0_9FUSO|nr:GntP family permease [Fusobacterium ulcerans]EHO80780.1 gluconate:H+ symporter (GntP) family transporter [Fusobacterium ulcerans 12-1B]
MGSTFVIVTIALSIILLIILTVKVKLHPFFALSISAFFFGIVSGHSIPDIIGAYSGGLGETIAGIGVVIAIGTVMGALLEHSGAAETMAETILKITGKKNADIGLAVTGYFVSIPVFCDSAFVLLSPLAKRMSKDTGTSMTTMAVALAMGLHATHMLVPPTPGPLAVAGILGANLGLVILLGMLVSIPVTLVAILAGRIFGKKYHFLPEIEEASKIIEENGGRKLPTPLMSFLPILLPIFLMLLRTVATLESSPLGRGMVYNIIDSLGQTIVALFIGLIIAFFTYKSVHPEDKEVWTFEGIFGEALKTAGQIVLIVGAGGAFATILKLSNLQEIVVSLFSGISIGIIVPYIIGAIFRTAIGSGTVGMITAASMLLPLVDVLGFNSPIGLVIAMLACAAGGFMVFHGNDDFFWVVTSTSGMKPETAYKVFPVISVFQSVTALICVIILKMIFL